MQCRRKCRLDRYKKQHKIQAVQPFQTLVVFAGKALYMIAQRQHMLLERRLPDHVVIGTDILLIRRQADLGVDDHLLVTRQHDQNVWLKTLAIRALEVNLGLVFAAFLKPCMLQNPLQNQLAPVALGFLAFQGSGQVGRFITQAQVQLLQALQLFTEGKAFAGFLLIAFFDALFKRLNAFFEGVEQLPQALIAGFGEALLALVKDLARQFGELCAQFIP